MCIPSIPKSSHILKNEKARGRLGKNGKKGHERKKEIGKKRKTQKRKEKRLPTKCHSYILICLLYYVNMLFTFIYKYVYT